MECSSTDVHLNPCSSSQALFLKRQRRVFQKLESPGANLPRQKNILCLLAHLPTPFTLYHINYCHQSTSFFLRTAMF